MLTVLYSCSCSHPQAQEKTHKSLQLEMRLIFNLKNQKMWQVSQWYNGSDMSKPSMINYKWKATYLSYKSRTGRDMSHISSQVIVVNWAMGYAHTKFVLERNGWAPKGTTQASPNSSSMTYFKRDTILFCWAEPRSCCIYLFRRWEQPSSKIVESFLFIKHILQLQDEPSKTTFVFWSAFVTCPVINKEAGSFTVNLSLR